MSRKSWDDTAERARILAAEATAITEPVAGAAAPLAVDWLAAAVRWLAEVAPSWVDLTGEVPAERSYRRLFHVPAFEVWLIAWPQSGRLQLHDHGGAGGGFEVVDGALEERSWQGRPQPDGGLSTAGCSPRTRRLGPGEPVAFDGSYIHDVRNSAGAVATSVHAYGAARRPMAFYRWGGGLLRTVGGSEPRSVIEAEITAEAEDDAVARQVPARSGPPGHRRPAVAAAR